MSATVPSDGHIQSLPRILVVDDDECLRETMYELLTSEGFGVLTASGSEACLRLLRDGFRGIILMDVVMPVQDGWTTIREIEKEGLLEGNIIAMLTGMDIPDGHMDGLQEIVIDYITKPFEPNELIAAVRRYLTLLDRLQTGA